MGDRIAVMNQGEIQQIASPLELYNRPANLFVAQFIGSPPMNLIPVQIKPGRVIATEQFRVTLPEKWAEILQPYDNKNLLLGIRPEDLNISPPATKNLKVKVNLVEALGNDTFIKVYLAAAQNISLQARIPPDILVQNGEYLWLSINLDKIHFFDSQTGISVWHK